MAVTGEATLGGDMGWIAGLRPKALVACRELAEVNGGKVGVTA